MEERRIVWDEHKNAENQLKHKVSFETASRVFLDPLRIERRDDSEHNNSGEERWQTLGRVGGVYFVVYTERKTAGGEETRIMSLRGAELRSILSVTLARTEARSIGSLLYRLV